ncbi:BREX-1 system phosphatase PglZ type A [Ruminococcaceae bacterium OttesenSCG-928-I18]|nr:BREX-1 system phosphatase PglZ type A [Ruminococcaceae bacterium OttesenSCG-928-I18]
MPELNLKQITDKLNAEFAGDTRKLVFWYDDKAEFVDDIDALELEGAKVYHLEPDNQFRTKIFLERQDTQTSYLVYAPFPKPPVRDNHLEDTLLYSKRFYADRASLLTVDLGIEEKYKPVIQKYIKFFAAKDRTQKFYDLEIENFTRESIEVALMSVLCKARTVTFDEVLRVILTDGDLADNRFLAEFEKYDLLAAFWRLCEEQYGYADVKPTLEKLVITMFVTYTERYLKKGLPQAWRGFVSYKAGNIIAFMDNLMNNILYRDRYDELSGHVASVLNAKAVLAPLLSDWILDCDSFAAVDELLLDWITDRLLNEDIGAKLGTLEVLTICVERMRKHFGVRFKAEYNMLIGAYHVIAAARYSCPDAMEAIIAQYTGKDYLIDRYYRGFYYAYDALADTAGYEKLRDLVENIYTNEYLAAQLPKWTAAFATDSALTVLPLQRSFYSRFIRSNKAKMVVIISDALRYEVGLELYQQLENDANCRAKIEPVMGVLPSYTRLGMAALLPHRSLEITDDFKVLADGLPTDDLKQRETILQQIAPNSRCIQYDDLKSMKKAELREVFTGMDVVYVYHNQIDARGDKVNTENEVFTACAEAVEEIYALIKKLAVNANTYHFVITADHGFIYKRDKLNESDKIGGVSGKDAFVNRRFIISQQALTGDGIATETVGRVLGNADSKHISFPASANVFKVPGGGQNYVHGGCSPQEMLVPVITVRTEKGHMETRPAQIALVSMVQKVTNLITSIDFMQTEPVNGTVKETSYKVFFVSDDNERISNECTYVADKKDAEPQKRMFRLRFDFKNKRYDRSKQYYLVAYDEKNDVEVLRHGIVMDIAFANDFGF